MFPVAAPNLGSPKNFCLRVYGQDNSSMLISVRSLPLPHANDLLMKSQENKKKTEYLNDMIGQGAVILN